MQRSECMNLSGGHGRHQGQERHFLQEIQRIARPVRDARLVFLNGDICSMEYSFNKTHNISSYNIKWKGHIIAGADLSPHPEKEKDYMLEIVPYIKELEHAEITLQPEEAWDDFFDSEEEGNELAWDQKAHELLKTMLKGYTYIQSDIKIQKRKDVYDLDVLKGDTIIPLRMVYEHDRFVISDKSFEPALYVSNLDTFDIRRFSIDATITEVLDGIYPTLRVTRRMKK
ncbi:hypothetical protein D0C36_19470 [Mucilaginibacter conchicola]|uniref:Uncharacterized protein n=1 Tax=Mucilaginibacter conchicola TaxID=2303333 RepID=A0A372NS81_9SPHI|nr:hypothetical protein [Mucilaginibacter conchicola]RFZ91123.1 hypothetical protein D0C36_19470 [Mucilaginibacter conchicola]